MARAPHFWSPRGTWAAVTALAAGVFFTFIAGACGTTLPARYVVERPVGELSFRRYQRVLDVEFPVQGRDAVGHTASYVLRESTDAPASSRSANVRFATAFVTVYSEAAGLTAEVREHLDSLGSYEVEPRDLSGWVLWLEGQDGGDDWALWVSNQHLVKIGGSHVRDAEGDIEESVEALITAYQEVYPSDLDEHGHAEEGTGSFGPSRQQREDQGDMELPRHLREGAPQE